MNSKEIKLPRRMCYSEKKSLYPPLEDLNVSCFGCDQGIHTRPVHVCTHCFHKLKDLNITIAKVTNRALCIDFDNNSNESVENSTHLMTQSVQRGNNYLSKGFEHIISSSIISKQMQE